MTAVDTKFQQIKKELAELMMECHESGDKTTMQLLHEVEEMLHISHESFLGNALQSIKSSFQENEE